MKLVKGTSVVLAVMLIATVASGAGRVKREASSSDAASVVLYGTADDGDNIVRIRTTADGGISPSPTGEVIQSDSSIHLSAAGLNHTTSFASVWKLNAVTVRSVAPITDTVTITLDSASGDSYNTVMAAQLLSGESSFYFAPQGGLVMKSGDEINVTTTNATTTTSVSASVRGEK